MTFGTALAHHLEGTRQPGSSDWREMAANIVFLCHKPGMGSFMNKGGTVSQEAEWRLQEGGLRASASKSLCLLLQDLSLGGSLVWRS